jgi:ankyrin repeat protein
MDLTQIASENENPVTCDDIILKAFSNNKTDIVSFILDGGYKPVLNKKDSHGSSIFHYLIQHSNNNGSINNYVNSVLTKGEISSDILNLQNGGGDTAFHIAIREQNHDIAHLLEQAGASRLENNDGEMPYTLNSPTHVATHVATQQEIGGGASQSLQDTYLPDTIQSFDIPQFIEAFANKNNTNTNTNTHTDMALNDSTQQDGGQKVFKSSSADIFVKRNSEPTAGNNDNNRDESVEQFVQKIVNKLQNNDKKNPSQAGGGKYKMQRHMIKEADIGVDSSEAQHMTRLYRNHVDDLHQETIKQIKELMGVDDNKARYYKAFLYKKIKEEHPELNGYDRATEMLKQVKKETFKNVDINALSAEIEKHVAEKKKNLEGTENKGDRKNNRDHRDNRNKSKKPESISSSEEEVKHNKKGKRSKEVSSDSSLLED